MSTSRTTANKGPAALHVTATTHFWATKKFFFNMDDGVRTEPVAISAGSSTRLDGVATRSCILNRVVRRATANRFSRNQLLIDQIARTNARNRIGLSFEEQVNLRLSRLNEMLATLRPLVEPLNDPNREYPMLINTTDAQIILSFGNGKRPSAPPELPREHADPSALVEVWLRSSVIHQNHPATIREWSNLREAVREFQQAAGDAGFAVTAAEIPVKLTPTADWLLVAVGDETTLADRIAAREE
jgi:hypothetical protein